MYCIYVADIDTLRQPIEGRGGDLIAQMFCLIVLLSNALKKKGPFESWLLFHWLNIPKN